MNNDEKQKEYQEYENEQIKEFNSFNDCPINERNSDKFTPISHIKNKKKRTVAAAIASIGGVTLASVALINSALSGKFKKVETSSESVYVQIEITDLQLDNKVTLCYKNELTKENKEFDVFSFDMDESGYYVTTIPFVFEIEPVISYDIKYFVTLVLVGDIGMGIQKTLNETKKEIIFES